MRIVFYRNLDMPDYYLVYKEWRDANTLLEMFRHTGKHVDSGFPHLNVEIAYIFETDAPEAFFDYIPNHVATDRQSLDIADSGSYRAWYQFKTYEPEKWLEDFYASTKAAQTKPDIRTTKVPIQKSLF
jgi:hypothetical protein